MLHLRTALFLGACCFSIAACNGGGSSDTGESVNVSTEAGEATFAEDNGPELGDWGIDLDAMDQSVAPGDDFYRFVNGGWLESFVIPPEFSNYGSFTVLFERSEERVKTIIEDAATGEAAPGSAEQKVGDYFAAYIDTDAIEAIGLTSLQPRLDAIAALDSHEAVAAVFADPAWATRAPVGMRVDIDNKNPERYVVYLSQSGLGMPNRDYYLRPEFADKRDDYRTFLTGMLSRAGVDAFRERADEVFALELRLAEVHWDPAKRRNADLTYNLYTRTELEDYAPALPWTTILGAWGIADQKEFVLREQDAIQASAVIFADTPVEVWKNYLLAHTLAAYADVLPTEIDAIDFAFYGRSLSGTPQQRERWKRGVAAVNASLGEAVGQIYVERYFPPESKAQMDALVENLKAAFAARLETLEWMGEDTKAEARDKLASFNTKIGYPDVWTDYSRLEIRPDDALGNRRRADLFEHEEMIARLGQPIDEDEWFMTPQTVNAYYSRNRNEIVFPAAILQAPFFDPLADPAVNYGGIGAVIGHEIGHGFDDQGRKADGTGLQRDWWTGADAERFDTLAAQLGAQYATYSPVEGLFVNPDLTMGENIGDLGGVTMAYDAYRLSLDGNEPPVLDGFSADQRFFMAWAQVWKRQYREDELKRRLVTDSHSPSEYRTNGVVRNMTPWYDAFGVKEDDELYLPPEERVQIW